MRTKLPSSPRHKLPDASLHTALHIAIACRCPIPGSLACSLFPLSRAPAAGNILISCLPASCNSASAASAGAGPCDGGRQAGPGARSRGDRCGCGRCGRGAGAPSQHRRRRAAAGRGCGRGARGPRRAQAQEAQGRLPVSIVQACCCSNAASCTARSGMQPPTRSSARARRAQVLQHEAQFLEALPSAQMYEKSYMHRDAVTQVATTATDFFITGEAWSTRCCCPCTLQPAHRGWGRPWKQPARRASPTTAHRPPPTHPAGSVDGHIKFWKKQAVGIEFVKYYRWVGLGWVCGLTAARVRRSSRRLARWLCMLCACCATAAAAAAAAAQDQDQDQHQGRGPSVC
jgi:hypothetical protein